MSILNYLLLYANQPQSQSISLNMVWSRLCRTKSKCRILLRYTVINDKAATLYHNMHGFRRLYLRKYNNISLEPLVLECKCASNDYATEKPSI